MSSAKDYVLEVFPSTVKPELNVKKFVVKDRPSYFVNHLRVPLLSLLISVQVAFISYMYTFKDEILDLHFLLSYSKYRYLVAEILIFSSICLVYLRQERKDTLIVMKDIGVQLNSEGLWKHFGNSNERNCFIPQTEIMDLVIHEGFHGFGQVIFYMCILTKNKNADDDSASNDKNVIKIVFPAFLPRKDILLQVWTQSRQVLFGSSRRYWRRVPGQGLKECK